MTEPRLLHEWFERQAARTPLAVAAAAEEGTLTYAELDARAEALADRLAAAGAGSETSVAVLLERSLDTIVSLLAILKSGAAFLPLAPAYPAERLRFMLEDSGARILITRDGVARRIGVTAETLLDPRDATQAAPRVRTQADASELAYMIYTSGMPNGESIDHRSASTFLQWASSVFTPDELAGTLASTSICCDLAVFELLLPLAAGGTVILARNVLQLAAHPARDAVTLISTVPTAMAELLRLGAVPRSVRVVNLAHEPLERALVDRIYALPHVERVLNLYGSFEETTHSTHAIVPREDARLPIAQPDETEATLASIWREVLNVPAVVGEDNFFRLGGDSLLAIRMLARIHTCLGVDLAVDCVFEQPTLAALAARIAATPAHATEEPPAFEDGAL